MDNTKSDYVSLFDYQGRPDKERIGKLVYQYSKFRKVRTKNRFVPGKGINVMLYPKWFLDEYFLIQRVLRAPIKFFK